MNVLIGSRALNYWFPEAQVRPQSDWDIISNDPIDGSEWHDPATLYNQEFANRYCSHHTIEFNGHTLRVMLPMGLALIKRSHLWRDLSFQKHVTHFHKWLFTFYNQRDTIDQQFLQRRIDLTKQMFPQGNPNLMQKKDDFFADAVTKKYDHDWLHELFAYHNQPLYVRLLRDPNLAWCDKDKWETLSDEEKTQCVAEEVYVISTERFLVPNDWKYPAKRAFMKSADKVCTTLCSGWFRDFAIDNYPKVLQMFDQQKFNAVQQVINSTPEFKRKFYNGNQS